MLTFISRRLIQSILTALAASFIVYGAMQLVPGDPVKAMFFPEIPAQERIDAIREELGLNKPFIQRYFIWLSGVFRWDFGTSYKQYQPVSKILMQNIPQTVELAIGGVLCALLIGIPAGVAAGVTKSKLVDNTCMTIALIGVSAPSFWVGLLLILTFSLRLRWLPTFGAGSFAQLVLPAITMGVYGGGYLSRFVRSSILEAKHQEHVSTARAKGLRESTVNLRHVIRNAMIPVVTMLGILAGFMLGGAVITETVFGRPGIGNILVRSISSKDFPLVQALLFFTVSVFVVVNLLVDISYAFLDPRIRYD